MGRRARIHYTEADKTLMWERWRQGESLNAIGRLFDRHWNFLFALQFRVNAGAVMRQGAACG